MPIYDQMMDLHKVQAQTAELQTQAYEQVQRGNMLQEQTKAIVTKEAVDQKTRDALQMLEQTRQKADAAEEERARGGDAPKPMDPIDENIVNAGKEYKKAEAAARAIAAAGGDVVEVNKMNLTAAKAQEALYHSINAKVNQQQEQTKLLGQAAAAGLAAVENADSSAPGESGIAGKLATQAAVRRMDAIVPGWSKNATLDHDLRGDMVPGPKTTAAFQQTMKAGTARGDALRDQQAQVRAQIDEARLKQDKINEDGRNERANITAATAQARTKSAEERAAASLAMRDVISKRKADAADAATHPNADLPKVYKDPSKEVRVETAAMLKAEIEGMPEGIASRAAGDYHHNVYDYRKGGLTRDEAEARALADVKAGFTAGSRTREGGVDLPVVGNLGGEDKVVKPSYDRTKRSAEPMPKATVPPMPKVSGEVPEGEAATERAVTDLAETAVNAPTPEIAMKLGEAKVHFTMTGGIIRFPNEKTANKGIAMLPKGTLYIGPNGKTYPAP